MISKNIYIMENGELIDHAIDEIRNKPIERGVFEPYSEEMGNPSETEGLEKSPVLRVYVDPASYVRDEMLLRGVGSA